jgi:hypothetical protein
VSHERAYFFFVFKACAIKISFNSPTLFLISRRKKYIVVLLRGITGGIKRWCFRR